VPAACIGNRPVSAYIRLRGRRLSTLPCLAHFPALRVTAGLFLEHSNDRNRLIATDAAVARAVTSVLTSRRPGRAGPGDEQNAH